MVVRWPLLRQNVHDVRPVQVKTRPTSRCNLPPVCLSTALLPAPPLPLLSAVHAPPWPLAIGPPWPPLPASLSYAAVIDQPRPAAALVAESSSKLPAPLLPRHYPAGNEPDLRPAGGDDRGTFAAALCSCPHSCPLRLPL